MSLGSWYLEDSHPAQALANPMPSLPLEENRHPQRSCVQGQVPTFPETPRQPEKLEEESRPPAAAGHTPDEVLLERTPLKDLGWGRKSCSLLLTFVPTGGGC